MRILIAVDKFTGGAGNVAQQLASLLSQEEDFKVGLMLLNTEAKPKYDLSRVEIINRHEEDGCHIAIYKAVIRYVKSHTRLSRIINCWHADVIISFLNSISVPLLISQWNTKTPIIVSERSDPFYEWEHGRLTFKIQWLLSYLRANMIVYQFEFFESFFRFHYSHNRTLAIPNMLYKNGSNLAVSKTVDKSVIHFVTLASLYKVKRIDLMINIFSEVHQLYPNTDLNIYGDGPDRGKLESKVSDMGLSEFVKFYGVVTDPIDALCKNDIFLLTSEREGFPNAIIEAMSVGIVPVVFRFHEGISEIISDSKDGFVIEKGDIPLYVSRCCELVSNDCIRYSMAENATRVNEKYNKDRVLSKWIDCINKVKK